jgi:hypothetical protein
VSFIVTTIIATVLLHSLSPDLAPGTGIFVVIYFPIAEYAASPSF